MNVFIGMTNLTCWVSGVEEDMAPDTTSCLLHLDVYKGTAGWSGTRL